MGDLIVLPRAEPHKLRTPTPDRSAEILFFTGVRYVRLTDEVSSPVAKPRRRARAVDPEGTIERTRIDRQA